MSAMRYAIADSPVGTLLLARDEDGIREIRFPKGRNLDIPEAWSKSERALADVRKQLREYFEGKRREFDVPLAPAGTEFQRSVWSVLEEIPFGQTISYIDIANRLGNAGAVRAVGAANGANPIPIIIPCHRVIGADGSLTGYGGGLDKKRWLLEHEGVTVARQMVLFR